MGVRLGFRLGSSPFWVTVPLTRNRYSRRLTEDEIAEQLEYRERERKHRWEGLAIALLPPLAFLIAIFGAFALSH
jgi:hypothetical protein